MKRLFISVVLLGTLLLAGCGGGQASNQSGAPDEAKKAPKETTEKTAPAGSTSAGEKVLVPGGSFARLSPDELNDSLEDKDFTFVNVHIPFEGDIAGSDLSIPYDEIGQEKNLDHLPGKDAKIVLYCRSGSMSAEAARTLVRLGYENVRDLNGGMIAWENAGYQLEGV